MKKVLKTIHRLRGPGGCPWDRKQTLRSMRRCLVEESYEVLEAIDRNDYRGLKEELGDVLCVITMMARMAEEKGKFSFPQVASGLSEKLIRRHPHVFASHRVKNADEALEAWTRVKEKEKGRSSSGHTHKAYPALIAAQKVGKKAARTGFDWKKPGDVVGKIHEELAEVKRAVRNGKSKHVEEEIGDLLFSVAQLARKLGVESEVALRGANQKFLGRFRRVESLAKKKGITLSTSSIATLDRLWRQVKRKNLT